MNGTKRTTVISHGPLGREVTRLLIDRGADVRVVQRTEPADLPLGASFGAADTVILATGLTYDRKIWLRRHGIGPRSLR